MALGLGRTCIEVSPSIRHAYTAPADARDGEVIISTSEWNADHGAPDVEVWSVPGGILDPVATGSTEMFDVGTRARKRLPRGSQVRLQTYVFEAAPAGSTLKTQYTTDLTEATGWTDFGATLVLDSTGRKVSTWTDLPAALLAAAEVVIRTMVVSI